MYHLSSYVLGGIVTALVLTPFVSGPDRSFVGTLLATSVSEPTVSVNRALKGDRRAPASMIADRVATPQSVMPKSTKSSSSKSSPGRSTKGMPASFTGPDSAPAVPRIEPRPTNDSPAAKSRLLDGCESAFSEITDRQFAGSPSRCMAALPGATVQMAALN